MSLSRKKRGAGFRGTKIPAGLIIVLMTAILATNAFASWGGAQGKLNGKAQDALVDADSHDGGQPTSVSLSDPLKGATSRWSGVAHGQGAKKVNVVPAKGKSDQSAHNNPSSSRSHRRTLPFHGDIAKTVKGANLPKNVVSELRQSVALAPGFSGKLKKGASLTLVYDDAEKSGAGPTLRVASIRSGGDVHTLYRYMTPTSGVAYLNESGRGTAQLTLKTPVDKVEVSSGWGWRIHPVLGDKRFHQGVDFRAPRGTPALSAADGVIEEIGRHGNYGLYIRVRHASKLATAYAHLDRFAVKLKKGSVVNKGQPLGYIGTSGLATGPHLYYEVLLDKQHVNPLGTHKMTVPVHLTDSDLAHFKTFIQSSKQTMMD